MHINQASSKVGGHVTLLFSIQSQINDYDKQGSRGAGICIEKGVEINTIIKKGNGNEHVFSDEKYMSPDLYVHVIEQISFKFGIVKEYDWTFEVKSDLPFGQGFGCSASGALAATICVLKILNEKEIFTNALTIAHRVERIMSAGLGDVAALSAGGIELRLEPGLPLPPNEGLVVGWKADFPVLLCWINDEEKHTSEYIDNEDWKMKISLAGEACVSKLNQYDWTENIWDELLKQSNLFCKKSGLLEDSNRKKMVGNIENELEELQLNDVFNVRLCMLGTSAIILPNDIEMVKITHLEQMLHALKIIGFDGCITNVCSNPIC